LTIAVLGGGMGRLRAAGRFLRCRGTISACAAQCGLRQPSIGAAGSRIVLKDANGRHDVHWRWVTSDIAKLVGGAELILCPAPGFAQHDIAGCSRRI